MAYLSALRVGIPGISRDSKFAFANFGLGTASLPFETNGARSGVRFPPKAAPRLSCSHFVSGYRESNPDLTHPMGVYCHYTISRFRYDIMIFKRKKRFLFYRIAFRYFNGKTLLWLTEEINREFSKVWISRVIGIFLCTIFVFPVT